MSVISGFVIAVVAGWLVPDARRAAVAAAVPWLVVVAPRRGAWPWGTGRARRARSPGCRT